MSMPTCPSCIYAQGICEKTGVKIRYSTGCTYHKPKQITNADRVRAMMDEELVQLIMSIEPAACPFRGDHGDDCRFTDCEKCWLDWLKQEVTE